MSINRILTSTPASSVGAFGIGTTYGVPTTIAVAQTSTVTLTGTVLPAGQYLMTGVVAGISMNLVSTTNSVTGTFAILNGAPGHIVYDGVSGTIVNATTSVTLLAIAT
jgi:hypothetical protein